MKLLTPDRLSLFRTRVARRLILALVLAGILPLLAALGVAFVLLEFSVGVGLNQTVQEALEGDLRLYAAIFDAKKSEYRAVARMTAIQLAAEDTPLDTLVQSHPELSRLTVEKRAASPDPQEDEDAEAAPVHGEVLAQAQRAVLPPGRQFEVVERLKGGRALRAEFHLPPHFDEGLEHARQMGETYGAVTRARGAITRGLITTFLVVVLAVLFGAVLLAGTIARSITRKLAVLAAAARQAAQGNLEVRVDDHWKDELGDLARAFNSMLGEISSSRDRIVYLEKISGWQEVARRLAHEIKNPLTPIVLAVQEIAQKVPPEPASYARLVATASEIIQEEASTLRRLVQEFSDFARLPDVHMEPTDVAALVRDFSETAKDIHQVAELSLELSASSMWAGIDRVMFRRVLHNLVANGVEAQGVRLTDSPVDGKPRPKVTVRVYPVNMGMLALDVDDAGPGVPPMERQRIFEPYITTKQHGTGLGLAIVKKIVLQHGGSIVVGTSREGGASFQVRLPVVPTPLASSPQGDRQ